MTARSDIPSNDAIVPADETEIAEHLRDLATLARMEIRCLRTDLSTAKSWGVMSLSHTRRQQRSSYLS